MNLLSKLKEVSFRGKLLAGLGNKKPTVAVIPLQGTISSGSGFRSINLEKTRKMIDKAFSQRNLKTVLLSVNSPGGSAVQSDLVSSYIKAKALKGDVEVIVFVEDVAASGGYWLACTGSRIYASRSSVVGSIGVISAGLGYHELIQKYGVERRVFTAGDSKSVMDPLSPLKESDVKKIKDTLNSIHEHFIDHVKGSRGTKLRGEDKELFNGEYWTGMSALELGLIDGIDNLDAFVEREYGDTVRVYRAKRQGGLVGLFTTFLDTNISNLANLAGLEQFIQHQALQAPTETGVQSFSINDTAADEIAKHNLK